MKHPYYTTNQLMHEHYGQKVRKICIDGGFTCPNRDGTCGTGGCTFCGARGAGEQLDPTKTIREQAEAVLKNAAPDSKWIVYFQNFTNTYASVEVLRERYDAALFDERVKVLDIGTRPDCITEEIADLLAEYAQKYEVWTELGLQTANDRTASAINRGYDLSCFLQAVRMLKSRGLPVIVHMIVGLPDETLEDILHTVDVLNQCRVDGVKIHSLFVMKETVLAEQYKSGTFTPISMQTYIDWAIAVLTHIRPETVIHRVTGNCLREQLLAPDWIPQRDLILTTIDRKMAANSWTQGCFYEETSCSMRNRENDGNCTKEEQKMDFSAKKAVIFDLDGTLLDTLADLRNSVNAALEAFGYPARTTDEVRRFVGNGIAKLVERALPDGNKNPDYEAVTDATRAYYAKKCRENTKPYDGIPEMLDTLREKGYQLAVVSNKPDQQVKKLCADFFSGKIDTAIGQKEGVLLKPAPDSLFAALEALHCKPEEAVYVGDSDVDVQTAQNAGIPCISVLWGFRDRDFLEANGAQHFAETPAETHAFF